ncbi:MAG: dehydrogenase [Chloroflexi bacterium]|nr:dehydrogenase [Chloroflexota bacterium]
MSKSCFTVTFTAREQAELLETPIDTSELKPDEVAGHTLYTLISAGTELNGAYLADTFPRTPGYAAVFEVDAVGSAVENVKIGDRRFCMGLHRSYQRVTVKDSLPVPDSVQSAWAPFIRLMGVTMATLTTTPARPPELVLVTGLGPVGHLGAQIFHACGYQVIAVDPDANRQSIMREVGIPRVEGAVPLDDPTVVGKVALHVECSGHEKAALDGCKALKKDGEMSQVAAPWSRRTEIYAQELLRLVFFNYLTVRSGWEWKLPLHPTPFQTNSIWGNFAAAMDWLATKRVVVADLYELVDPHNAQQVFQDLLHQRTESLAQVFDWTKI